MVLYDYCQARGVAPGYACAAIWLGRAMDLIGVPTTTLFN